MQQRDRKCFPLEMTKMNYIGICAEIQCHHSYIGRMIILYLQLKKVEEEIILYYQDRIVKNIKTQQEPQNSNSNDSPISHRLSLYLLLQHMVWNFFG